MKETYDWNLPLSIRAAYVIAGDLYLGGHTLQSARMVLFAALLHECMSNRASLVVCLLCKNQYKYLEVFTYIYPAVVNTQTAKLLHDFISEKHPNRGWAQKTKSMSNEQQSRLDQPLYVDNTIASTQPMSKLVTLFLRAEADQYREFQVCEDCTLQQLFMVCYLLSSEFAQINLKELRYCLVWNGINTKRRSDCHFVVSVNERHLYLTTSGKKTLKQLGINEGDVCVYRYIKKESISGEFESTAADNTALNNRKKSSRRTKTSRSKPKKGSSTTGSPTYQEPTTMQLKEAHSKSFEPVINELRPRLQPIRRNLDSLTLERTRPKERRDLKVASNDKENINNFTCTNEVTAKAGKTLFPIMVGEESNLYKSFKPSHRRNSHPLKTISLDLHGMSKDEALQTLDKKLPKWINIAMNGRDPWVIPVDIICGGGNQILSEVVAAWIKRENQVGNRPKNYNRM